MIFHLREKTLIRYIDSDLPEKKSQKVNEHLRKCEQCSKKFNFLSDIEKINMPKKTLSDNFKNNFLSDLKDIKRNNQPDIAEIKRLIGNMTISYKDDSETTEAFAGMTIKKGAKLKLDKNSTALLGMNDGSYLYINKETELDFSSPQYNIRLDSGEIFAMMKPQKDLFKIKTPSAMLTVVGTDFDTKIGDKGETTLSVLKGKVSFENISGKTMAAKNQQVKASNHTKPKAEKIKDSKTLSTWANQLTPKDKRKGYIMKYILAIIIIIAALFFMVKTYNDKTKVVEQTTTNGIINDKSLPQNAEAYYNSGVEYDKQGKFEQGIADYTEAIRINPQYAEAYCKRGTDYCSLQKYEQGIADYAEAIRINPHMAEAYLGRGNGYFAQGKYKEAKSDWEKAVELDPTGYIGEGAKMNLGAKQLKTIPKVSSISEVKTFTPKISVGDKYNVDFSIDIASEAKDKGFESNQKINILEELNADIVNQLSDGNYEYALELTSVVFTINQNNQTLVIDSDAVIAGKNPLADIQKRLMSIIGSKIIFTIDKNGKMIGETGIKEFLEKSDILKPDLELFSEGALMNWGNLFSSEYLPNEELREGLTWDKESFDQMPGTEDTKQVLKYEYIGKQNKGGKELAVFKNKGLIKPIVEKKDQYIAHLNYLKEDGQTSGEIRVDPDLGIIAEQSITQDLLLYRKVVMQDNSVQTINTKQNVKIFITTEKIN